MQFFVLGAWLALLLASVQAKQLSFGGSARVKNTPASGRLSGNVEANPDAIVQPNPFARITVLTEQLLRLEWNPRGEFIDAPSFAIINRNLPVPEYRSVIDRDGWLRLETKSVRLSYLASSRETFSDDNLKISFQLRDGDAWSEWKPSMDIAEGNLLGTVRTLDGDSGNTELNCHRQQKSGQHCAWGLISRRGFYLLDDTAAVRLETQHQKMEFPWVLNQTAAPVPEKKFCKTPFWKPRKNCSPPSPDHQDEHACTRKGCCYSNLLGSHKCYLPQDEAHQPPRDWYFFGHGRNYKKALLDFTLVSGKIPMPPRYAFGTWSSRYWAYNDVELLDMADKYTNNRLPLDVMVIDMDWHKTFYGSHKNGWTGWAWDEHLFPNASAFLSLLKKKYGLRTTVNLHPADGIRPWDDNVFPALCKRLGYPVDTTEVIPFQSTNATFMREFLNVVIGQLEKDGVDFFWLDWQQGEDWKQWTGIDGLNPTLWLNYVFWNRLAISKPEERPMNFHRWGGLGNHRFPIGFSGDVFPSWKALTYQTFFTATASNVLFSYWSHDIGGHIHPCEPELYTRWVQFGVFSPIFRSHSTKSGDNVRYFWKYPRENFDAMQEAVHLRERLLPYIYSMAKATYTTGVGLVQPLYYDWPELDEAYQHPNQYLFGNAMMLKPVTQPGKGSSKVARESIWLPPGTWMEWHSGKMLAGPGLFNGTYFLNEIPVFLRAGSIVPMQNLETGTGTASKFPRHLTLQFYLDDQVTEGEFWIHDDDGVTNHFASPDHVLTTHVRFQVLKKASGKTVRVKIDPQNGEQSGLRGNRTFSLKFLNSYSAIRTTVNGVEAKREEAIYFDGPKVTAGIHLGTFALEQSVDVSIEFPPHPVANVSGLCGKYLRLRKAKEMLDDMWEKTNPRVYQSAYPHLLDALETFQRVTYEPHKSVQLLPTVHTLYDQAVQEVSALAPAHAILEWLQE